MSISRNLAWDGFFNTRDLGGLPTRSGGVTRFGAFIRSADLRFVTDDGWEMAREAGVRTVVDLRNPDEIRPAVDRKPTEISGTAQFTAPAECPDTPLGINHVEIPIDDIDDAEFWQHLNREQLNGTPLYYRPFLERKAERCAAAIHALASAAPGAVLFHCGAGRDRTGLVALLLLALADVEPSAVVEDYEMSLSALPALLARMSIDSLGPSIPAILASRGTTVQAALFDILEGFNVEHHLSSAGASPTDIEIVRSRILGDSNQPI